MASTAYTELIQHLRRTLAEGDAGPSDAQLLDRVVGQRDQAALTAIVRRHGPMVWQVCSRLLRHHQDAEDAFQATFLVLVRRAAAVRPGDRLARWLFGVARQTARYARATIALRHRREKQVEAMLEPAAADPEAIDERHALLECELNRLPEPYRTALIACALEGRPRRELAQQLGVPEGTVSGWLSRGKKLLAKRLARQGLAVSAGAALLVKESAQAALPPQVLTGTIAAVNQAAQGSTTGPGVISAGAIQLMEGVLRTMLLKKLKGLLTVLVLAALCTAGAVVQWCSAMSASDPAAGQAPAAQAAPAEAAKPVRIDDAGVQQLYYGDGDAVASISVRWHPVESKTENGPGKALMPESLLQIWDAKTGKLRQLAAQEKDVYFSMLAVAAGRKRAVLIANKIAREGPPTPSEVRLLNPQTWELERTLAAAELKLQGGEWVGCAALAPDGKILALGGGSQRTEDGVFVEIWDLTAKKLRGGTKKQAVDNQPQAVPGKDDIKHGSLITLTFSPDGKWVAGGDNAGKVYLYDAESGKLKHTLQEDPATQVLKLAFSPDSRRLATTMAIEQAEGKPVAADRAVHLWNVATGKLERSLGRDNHMFFMVAFSPDGKRIAAAGAERQDTKAGRPAVALWDAETGALQRMVPHGFGNPEQFVSALAFAPDGRTLAIGSSTVGDVKNDGKMSGQISFVTVP